MAQVQQPVDATTYGDKQAQEQQAASVDVAQAVGAQNEVQLPPPTAPVPAPQQEQPQQPQQQFAPRNLMQIVPPSLLFQGARQKLPSQVQYDAGLLWKVLLSDPNVSDMTKVVAKRLLGEE